MNTPGLDGRVGTGRWISAPKPRLNLNCVFPRKNDRAANDLDRSSQLNTWWGRFCTMRLCYRKPRVSPLNAVASRQLSNSTFASHCIRKVLLLPPKPTTLPTYAMPQRPHLFEIEVKGWGIQFVRKRKISSAPWNTSMKQSHQLP